MRSLRESANWKAGTGRISLFYQGRARGIDGDDDEQAHATASCRLPTHALKIEGEWSGGIHNAATHCVYVCMCVCIYIYMYVYMYICTMNTYRCGSSARLSPLCLIERDLLPFWSHFFAFIIKNLIIIINYHNYRN